MKRVSKPLIVALLAVSLLCGCGGRQKRMAAAQKVSDAKDKMTLMEQQIENQQKQIETLEAEIAELKKN